MFSLMGNFLHYYLIGDTAMVSAIELRIKLKLMTQKMDQKSFYLKRKYFELLYRMFYWQRKIVCFFKNIFLFLISHFKLSTKF